MQSVQQQPYSGILAGLLIMPLHHRYVITLSLIMQVNERSAVEVIVLLFYVRGHLKQCPFVKPQVVILCGFFMPGEVDVSG